MKAYPPVGPGCRHIPGSEFANDTVGIRKGLKHLGADFQPPAPGGTSPVLAVVAGTVEALFTDIEPGDWRNPLYPGHTGNIVAVRDDLGRVWTYQHGRNFQVKLGQRVNAGDHLCDIWKSGRATNTHLHLGLRVNGEWRDPAPVLRALGVWPLTFDYSTPTIKPAATATPAPTPEIIEEILGMELSDKVRNLKGKALEVFGTNSTVEDLLGYAALGHFTANTARNVLAGDIGRIESLSAKELADAISPAVAKELVDELGNRLKGGASV